MSQATDAVADTTAVRFIEAFCRHSKGEWAGQPLRLAPWQRTLLNDLMASGPDGRRLHRIGYVGLPRKNGKSTSVAQHLRNVSALPLGDHGWRLREISRTSTRKIDGAIATVMAVAQALEPVQPTRGGWAFPA